MYVTHGDAVGYPVVAPPALSRKQVFHSLARVRVRNARGLTADDGDSYLLAPQ